MHVNDPEPLDVKVWIQRTKRLGIFSAHYNKFCICLAFANAPAPHVLLK
jgi:hypothetical protein